MKLEELIQLYIKERKYEKERFGDYKDIKSLNVASFIILLKNYIEKAEKSYSGNWETDLPPWLVSCNEQKLGSTAPVKVYEEIIKIMALAGAALETYTVINPEKWREKDEIEHKEWK